MNIFVSNLNFKVNSDQLKQLFDQYGEVTSAKIINDKFSGRSRGFGFVEMKTDADGQKAIDALHETEFEGRNVQVSIAKPRENSKPREYSGGGNRDNGNGNRY